MDSNDKNKSENICNAAISSSELLMIKMKITTTTTTRTNYPNSFLKKNPNKVKKKFCFLFRWGRFHCKFEYLYVFLSYIEYIHVSQDIKRVWVLDRFTQIWTSKLIDSDLKIIYFVKIERAQFIIYIYDLKLCTWPSVIIWYYQKKLY